jgi:transcriptional antiterminator RfaH
MWDGMAVLNDEVEWFAIRTKSKEEDRAEINLQTWQVETFAPKLRERRTSGYGEPHITKPLFSRYIFARFNAGRQLHNINYTRGVQNVVSFGGIPISIDEKVICFLRAQVGADGFIRGEEELKSGDRVRIKSGPFENLRGIFKRSTRENDRVRVLLDAIHYQSHILIDRTLVEKAPA